MSEQAVLCMKLWGCRSKRHSHSRRRASPDMVRCTWAPTKDAQVLESEISIGSPSTAHALHPLLRRNTHKSPRCNCWRISCSSCYHSNGPPERGISSKLKMASLKQLRAVCLQVLEVARRKRNARLGRRRSITFIHEFLMT